MCVGGAVTLLFVRGREGRGGEGRGGEGRGGRVRRGRRGGAGECGSGGAGGGGCHPALLAEGEPGLDLPDPPAAAAVTWRADMD